MSVLHRRIDAPMAGSPIIVAPVAVSPDPQDTTGIGVRIVTMPGVGLVIGVTVVCPTGTMMVTLDEDHATAFAMELTVAQLLHAQALDRGAERSHG
ncbi:hypothetical protein [Sphingomonas sp. SORGH_AS_0879]|uniref:hypothetical protein n=1 Tax=Sphingomonas sp. SORGH_AS_0879 TaxID=3041790 RepID=UPI0027850429|nr:hypothetical protein [Sphingomonas sp. SORGH_AS_0879]MDQ1229296.1 hypothetical protein [Sphingomonas sp. SORGH_AS_0879]